MEYIKRIATVLKARYNTIKDGHITLGSLLFLKIVIAFSFIPVVVTVGMLLAVITFHYTDAWAFQVIDTGMKIIDHIWSAQLVAGVLAYSQKLVDKDGDGVPDVDERKV